MACNPAPMAIDEPSISAGSSESANTSADAFQEILYVRVSPGQAQDDAPSSSPILRQPSASSSSDRLSDFGGALSSDCSAEDATSSDLALSSPLSLLSVVDAAARTRAAVAHDELDARADILTLFEASERIETSRAERTARDELRRARALYFRSALVTTSQRGMGPSVWPRHGALPAAVHHAPKAYAPAPARALRSCLRRSSVPSTPPTPPTSPVTGPLPTTPLAHAACEGHTHAAPMGPMGEAALAPSHAGGSHVLCASAAPSSSSSSAAAGGSVSLGGTLFDVPVVAGDDDVAVTERRGGSSMALDMVDDDADGDGEDGDGAMVVVPAAGSVSSGARSGGSSRSSSSSGRSSGASARRVVITDRVAVQAGPELFETDGEMASAAWRCISFYAPVRHMVMTSLKARYGADAADDDGWMSTVERFAWLDDMFCSVKDAYQLVHNEEAAAFAGIMDEFRAMPANAWWSRLGAMWL